MKGYTLTEVIAVVAGIIMLGLFIGVVWAAIHFIVKFW